MSSIGLISENDNSTVLAEYTGLNRVATSFQSEDALEKEWIHQVDCSNFVAKIIYTFYQGKSVAPILTYKSPKLENFAKH